MVFIDPYFNHTAALVGDKWMAPRMGTDAALGLGIAFVWLTEDLYDRDYVATRTHGFDEWKHYVLGESDGVPKRRNGRRKRPSPPVKYEPWPGVGLEEDHAGRRRLGGLGRRLSLVLRGRVRPHHDRIGGHAGPGQAGEQHLLDSLRRASGSLLLLPGLL